MSEDRLEVDPLAAEKVSRLNVIDPGNAPIIYFDVAPSFGATQGVIDVCLAANRGLLSGDKVNNDTIAVAFLRCSPSAAISLRAALDKALLFVSKTDGDAN